MKITQLLAPLLVLVLFVHSSTQQATTPCYNRIGMASTFVTATSTATSTQYACGLSAANAANGVDDVSGADTLTLSIDSANCPVDCSDKAYACGEVQSAARSQFGYYECTMKASGIPGTVASCTLESTTKASYESIFVKFIGNDTTHAYIGYITNGLVNSAGPIDLKVDGSRAYHQYGFEWQSNYIKWFFDGKEMSSELGSRPLPKSPSRLLVNFVVEVADTITDDSGIPTASNVNRVFVAPTLGQTITSSFQNITYIPSIFQSCDSTGIVPGNGNYTGYDPEACSVAATSVIYEDKFASGWTTVGSTTHDIIAKQHVRSGSNSISWDVIPEAVLVFASAGTISQEEYSGFEFWVYGGGRAGQQIDVSLRLTGGQMSAPLNLNRVLSSGIQANFWVRVVLPFSSFGVESSAIVTGLTLATIGNSFGGTIYVDSLILGQKHPFCVNRTMIIYGDELSSNFADQSWGPKANLASTSPVFKGNNAISWTIYNDNGLKFHSKKPVDTKIWQGIQMYVNYQKLTGWDISLAITVNGAPQGDVKLLDYYGGSFPPGEWVKVVIPFSNFGIPAGNDVDGLQIKSLTGDFQGTMALDEIAFVSSIPEKKNNPNSAGQVGASLSLVVLAGAYLML